MTDGQVFVCEPVSSGRNPNATFPRMPEEGRTTGLIAVGTPHIDCIDLAVSLLPD